MTDLMVEGELCLSLATVGSGGESDGNRITLFKPCLDALVTGVMVEGALCLIYARRLWLRV